MKRTFANLLLGAGVLGVCAASAMASSVYVISGDITGHGIFGTVDTSNGAFQQIGPAEPDGYFGLAPGLNGNLVSLTYTGNLDSIDPSTGVPSLIGPTGLVGCLDAAQCTFNSPFAIGAANGAIYLTDESNRLFTVDPSTGKAILFSADTGLPAFPFVAGTQNPNGTFNFVDESLFGFGGSLYLTFDAFQFDFVTGMPTAVVIPPALYQVNLTTGKAIRTGATDLGIGATWVSNGSAFVFNDLTFGISQLDVSTGNTTPLGSFDPAAGVIQGALATPEPSTVSLLALAFCGVLVRRRLR